MSKFNVGDKVRIVIALFEGKGARKGDVGIIEEVADTGYDIGYYIRAVYPDGETQLRLFNADDLEWVPPHTETTVKYKCRRMVRLLTNGGYGDRLFRVGGLYEPVNPVPPSHQRGVQIRPFPHDDYDNAHQITGLYFMRNEFEWEDIYEVDVEAETVKQDEVTVTVPRDTAAAFVKAYAPSGMLNRSGQPPAPQHRALLRKVFDEALESAEVREAKRLLENQGYKVVKE